MAINRKAMWKMSNIMPWLWNQGNISLGGTASLFSTHLNKSSSAMNLLDLTPCSFYSNHFLSLYQCLKMRIYENDILNTCIYG